MYYRGGMDPLEEEKNTYVIGLYKNFKISWGLTRDIIKTGTPLGCHLLLQCMKVKSESEVAQSCRTLSNPMDCSLPGSSIHGIFPGKSTGVGCHCLLDLDKGKENGKMLRLENNTKKTGVS